MKDYTTRPDSLVRRTVRFLDRFETGITRRPVYTTEDIGFIVRRLAFLGYVADSPAHVEDMILQAGEAVVARREEYAKEEGSATDRRPEMRHFDDMVSIPGNWLARLCARWEQEKVERLWAESNEAAIIPIRENANEHKGLWEDRDDAYWLARLTMEVGDLGMALAEAHALPTDVILVMIGGIVTNWLRMRGARQKQADD